MADQILPEGLRFFSKHANAPDFVVGTLVVTMNDLFEFCKAHPELVTEYDGKKQLKIQILNSKAGKLYGAVDTYKAGEKKPEAKKEESLSDLPF